MVPCLGLIIGAATCDDSNIFHSTGLHVKNDLPVRPLLLFLLWVLSLAAPAAEPLKVYYFQRPPLYMTHGDGSAGGFITEIARLVLTEAGIACEFEEMPTLRIESHLKGRACACGIGWFKRPDREAWATFSLPIYRDLPAVALVNAQAAAHLNPGMELGPLLHSGLTLGVIEGFSYGDFADDAIAQAKPRMSRLVGEQFQLLLMAASGRIDYFFIGLEEASYLLDKHPNLADKLRIVQVKDWRTGNDRYFMFSKGVDQKTITRINQAILNVKKRHAYRQLTDFGAYLKK